MEKKMVMNSKGELEPWTDDIVPITEVKDYQGIVNKFDDDYIGKISKNWGLDEKGNVVKMYYPCDYPSK